MSKEKEIQARSISDKLKNISNETKVAYRYTAINFFIERMVARILTSTLKDDLVFKGGYVGLKVYNTQRYTIDLDAVLNSKAHEGRLSELKEAIESDLLDGVWFQFEKEEKLPHQTYKGGIKQVYRAGLGVKPGNISRAVVVHFDIGFGDSIVPAPVSTEMTLMLSQGSLSWRVYPVETIIAEKLHAFIFRDGGSSRAKDMYDLAFYLPQADTEDLKLALESCFKHRKTDLPENIFETMKSYDFEVARLAWKNIFTAPTKEKSFEFCLGAVLDNLERMSL
jgi:predicted nucleotidyltransferase component of viral defense system